MLIYSSFKLSLGDKAKEFLRDVLEGGNKKGERNYRRLSSSSSQKAEDSFNTEPKENSDAISDVSPSGPKLYPVSVLTMSTTPGSLTPLYDTPSSLSTLSIPPTPSSLDSGISISVNRQNDNVPKEKPQQLFSHSILSCPPMATNQKVMVTSPVPEITKETLLNAQSHPPLLSAKPVTPPVPPIANDRISVSPISIDGDAPDDNKMLSQDVDMISPVSASPVDSLTEYDVTKKPVESSTANSILFPTQFDPTLGLQGLLHSTETVTAPATVTAAPPLSDFVPVSPPEDQDPAISVVSPADIEVEEISGDESPEMVYLYSSDKGSSNKKETYKVKVEQLSSDDMEMSDDDNVDTVIEVNPASSVKSHPPAAPMPRHLPYMDCRPPPPLPPPIHPNHMFPHPVGMPPSLPFKPPPGAPPPPPPFFDPTVPPFHPPPHRLPPPGFHPYGGSPYHRPPMYPLPKGNSHKRSAVLGTKEFLDDMKREVMIHVCQQLRDVLLRDMRKKLVESSAFDSLDSFWERRERMVRKQFSVVFQYCMSVCSVGGCVYMLLCRVFIILGVL